MNPTSSTRPTWTEISRAALRSNYRILRERASRVDADAVAVIKANAYGHGAVEALATLADDGCQWFAVTCLDEARLLAPQLASHRMLILSGLFIGEVAEVVRTGFTPVLGSVQELAWLSATTPQQLTPSRPALAPPRQHGCAPPLIHAGNSASLFEDEQMAHLREIALHY